MSLNTFSARSDMRRIVPLSKPETSCGLELNRLNVALTVFVADRAFIPQRTQRASFARKCLLRTHHPSTELEDCVRRVFKRRIWCAVWVICIFCGGCLGGYEATLTVHRRSSSSVTSFLLLVFKITTTSVPCCSIGEVPKEQKEKKRRLVDVRLYNISFFFHPSFYVTFCWCSSAHCVTHMLSPCF